MVRSFHRSKNPLLAIAFVAMTLLSYILAPFKHSWLRLHLSMTQDEVNGMHLAMTNSKVPPSWTPERDRQYPLRTWTQDIRLWAMGTDVDVQRQGPVVAMRIGGTARELVRELDVQVLAQGMMLADANGQLVQTTGLECLIRALHRRYAPLSQELEIHCLSEILLFRRHPGEDTDAVISRFELARDKALAGAGFDMSWVGFAFLLMSILGIHKTQWPLLLAPTQGALPNTEAQYQTFINYIRRQGHLTDKGVDSVKNMNFYTGPEQQVESYAAMPYQLASTWEQPEQSYAWTEPEYSEASSGNSGESEPDLSDLHAAPYAVAGEQLYLAYRHAKRRWRKFTGGFKRRTGGKGRRKGKGRFGKGSGGKSSFGKFGKGKGKGKHYFTGQPDYYDEQSEQTYWTEDSSGWAESSWDQDEGAVYLGKGKFKRGNPVGKDGKKLECTLCGSTEHFIAKCPKNTKGMTHSQAQAQSQTGRTYHSIPNAQNSSASAAASSAAASSEPMSWGSDWGSRIYFARPAEKHSMQTYSVIELADGTEIRLEESDALHSVVEESDDSPYQPLFEQSPPAQTIRNYYLPPDENSARSAQLSRANDTRSLITRQFAFMWFMPAAFHAQVKIVGGGPALLIDPGAFDNLVGDEWVKEATETAGQAGQGCAWQKLKNRLAVEGVGKDSNEATEEAIVPICLEDGATGTFKAPVIPRSKLPALLGLQSLTRQRVLIDVFNKQLICVGQGGYKLQLSPGSKTYKLYAAKTGHLMLPCQNWKEARIAPGKPGIAL